MQQHTAELPFIHPILCDNLFNRALDDLDKTLDDVGVFWKAPRVPLMRRANDYVLWLKELGVSKKAIRWMLPMCVSTTPRLLACLIYGRDLSPIEELGERSVSSFIRFLMFARHYSSPQIRRVLIEDLGYKAKVARPLVRRLERDADIEKTRFEANKESELYKEVTFA